MKGEAVVVIDVQNGILDIPDMARPVETRTALDVVVNKIKRLLLWARIRGTPILFVQHDGEAGHRLERGTHAWQIRHEIAPGRDEPIIHKSACDSFFETSLSDELKLRGVTNLIVAGCMTQYCVDTSVRRAVSLGYDVSLVADGHMTADSGALTFDQIVAHHNALLEGFDAGNHSVRVRPLESLIS
jgi:nicotinamidase-related amidase